MARGTTVEKCAWSAYRTGAQDRAPVVSNAWRKPAASGGNHTIGLLRIGRSATGRKRVSVFQSCINMYPCALVAAVALDAEAAAAGTAEPSIIDAAALSARIAGMMACLMRMIFLHG